MSHTSGLGEGIVVEPRLPLRWQLLTASFDKHQLYEFNRTTFMLIEALEDQHALEHEPAYPATQDLQRLETRLNLLLDLVGQLLVQHDVPPAAQPVRLSVGGLVWPNQNPPALNSRIVLDIFLDTRHGRAIRLVATVEDIYMENDCQWIRARFDPLDKMTRDHLEKWIFRRHRREIAQAKG